MQTVFVVCASDYRHYNDFVFCKRNYVEAQSSFQQGLIIAWAAISYILWGMSFTVGDIPLWGITSLMTEDQNQRSQLLGLARMAAGIGAIGVLVVQIAQVVPACLPQKATILIPPINMAG